MTLHTALGGSSAHRWVPCPGSVALSAGTADVESEYAQAGTVAHKVVELCLRTLTDPEMHLGEVIDDVRVDEEMVSATKVMVEYARGLPGALLLEEMVSFDPLDPPTEMFGTADVISYTPELLELVDFKYGSGVFVEAEGNYQGAFYLVGASLRHIAKRYRFTIVQPRIEYQGPVIRSWDLTALEVMEWAGLLLEAAGRAMQPDAPLVPGEKQCRWCPAKTDCPALKRHMLDLARSEFDLPAVPAESLSELMKVADAAEHFIKAIREQAFERLNRGEEVPGYKLVPKRAVRKWTDEEDVVLWLRRSGLLRAGTKRELLSPAQMEKTEVRVPDRYVLLQSSGLKVVEDSSPLPAITAGPQVDFDFPIISDGGSSSDSAVQ